MSFCSASFQRDLIKMKYYRDAEAGAGLVKCTVLRFQQLNVGKGTFLLLITYTCMIFTLLVK